MQTERLKQAWQWFHEGQYDSAIQAAGELLSSDGNNLDALLLLGLACGRTGQYAEAESSLRRVLEAVPGNFDAQNWLAFVQVRMGEFTKAEQSAKLALKLSPSSADACGNLGLAYLGQRKLEEAIKAFGRGIASDPASHIGYYNLGQTLLAKGDLEAAIESFQVCERLQPSFRAAHLKRIEALERLERWKEVGGLGRRLIKQHPEEAAGYEAVGSSMLRTGDAAAGLELLERAYALSNGQHELESLTYGYQLLGKFKEAEELLVNSAKSLAEPSAWTFLALASIGFGFADHPDLLEKAIRVSEQEADPDATFAIHCAIGRAFDVSGRFEEAMSQYDAANLAKLNEARAKGFEFSKEELHVQENAAEVYLRLAGQGVTANETELPLLVVGMIRSGTTLMHQVLTADQRFAGVGELGFLYKDGFLDRRIVEERLSAQDVQEAADQYFRVLSAKKRDATVRVVDKLPANFTQLGLVQLALPHAKVIHMLRDPVDTCLSIWMTPNRWQPTWGHSKKNIVAAYRVYQRVMERWRELLPAGFMLEIRYEDLVQDPESTTRRVTDFLGIEWSERLLRHGESPELVTTPSFYTVRQPMFTSSVGRSASYRPWLDEFAELLSD